MSKPVNVSLLLSSCLLLSSAAFAQGAPGASGTPAAPESMGTPKSEPAAGSQSGSQSGAMPSKSTYQTTSVVAPADKAFFTKAAIGGMTEVKAGQLAQEKGTTDEIKAFGKKMVDDHTVAGDKLKTLASSKSVTLPTDLDAMHKATITKLEGANGEAFDAAFVAAMKKGHADTIALFEKASKSKDTDVASFASSTLPTLKEHQSTIPSTSHKAM